MDFTTPRARLTDPATSHAAANSVDRSQMSHAKRVIVTLLMLEGPMTDEELLLLWNDRIADRISQSGLRTRRSELVDAGLVRDSGERRPLESGRMAIVWEATTTVRPRVFLA